MWPFTRKRQPESSLRQMTYKDGTDLVFKSRDLFFAYNCASSSDRIQEGQARVAFVIDPSSIVGDYMPRAVSRNEEGMQVAMLRVASPDGGFYVIAATPGQNGEELKLGDLVVWMPEAYSDEKFPFGSDKRSRWFGFIYASIRPRLKFPGPEYDVICKYI